LDFADVKAIMQGAGSALMGIGEASGENRTMAAAKMAISSPLLDISIDGAKGILFIVVGGPNLTMNEVNEAASVITESVDTNAKIIFGVAIDETMKDNVKITVVATGFGGQDIKPTGMSFSEPKYSMNRLFSKKSIETKIEEAKSDKIEKKEVEIIDNEASVINIPTIKSRPPRDLPEEEEDLEIPAFIRKKMK
jgi:cell division protein FtsZ